jgi:transposase
MIEALVADKGYHSASLLSDCAGCGIRTYIPERKQKGDRRWTDKPAGWRDAVYANRRRVTGKRGKRLNRRRSEFVERTFAHMCETGAARRSWLCGLDKIKKRYTVHAAGRNLGVMMRALFGVGTPRTLQTEGEGLAALGNTLLRQLKTSYRAWVSKLRVIHGQHRIHAPGAALRRAA